jgi:pyruvate formate lyase activating enzyme
MVDGEHTIDRSKCAVCLDCTAECYAEALVPVCREVTLAQLEKSILTDLEYFRQSNGGVTFSGGESMLQIDYLAEILKVCKRHGIHTAVDTAGAVSFEAFERILPYCDLILYDIKAYNGDVHKKLTGVSNTLVLDNIKRLSELNRTALWVRVPVVVGANIDEMVGIADFLRGIKFQKCELLAYHRLGEGKYKSLGITNQHVFDTPDDELLNKIKDIFKANNITV